ncbi:MAG: ABC transporter ATP-binding protein [Candidatus Nomurabacteria bacterium]|nr:MAG: ABC transporter ATP-binding protein [Candidatus Nomurabacteria bacterium]HRV76013.1 ABC transporter ATP-binding protein [Candidatus Saccharimonadales bacterium]
MEENKEVAIKVEGVYKDFILPHELNNNLKQKILHPFKRTSSEKQHALKNISFEVNKGEFFGIVGRNGSGKSTLLKVLAKIYTPTKGNVSINGSLTPFIELGVGFNPELTGRENIYMNGAMLGFNKKEVNEMYDEIVEFAELEKFMDQKLKNYSSGMQVRLAFSIAIRAKTDILIIDEVLAVGDSNFQRKCYRTFNTLKEEGKTIVFVSHNMADVERYCDRVVVLDAGNQLATCDPTEAKIRYFQLNDSSEHSKKESSLTNQFVRWGSGEFITDKVQTIKKSGKASSRFSIGEDIGIKMSFSNISLNSNQNLVVGLNVTGEKNENIIGPNTKNVKLDSSIKELILWFKKPNLNSGTYSISVTVFDPSFTQQFDSIERPVSFSVYGETSEGGLVIMDNLFEVIK